MVLDAAKYAEAVKYAVLISLPGSRSLNLWTFESRLLDGRLCNGIRFSVVVEDEVADGETSES